ALPIFGRHARRVGEFPSRPLAPPGGEEGTARVELLDALRTGLGDVDVPARIDRHAVRLNELPFALAVAAPGGEEGAARVELQDAVVARIRYVDVPARVGRHAGSEERRVGLYVVRRLTASGGEGGAAGVDRLD